MGLRTTGTTIVKRSGRFVQLGQRLAVKSKMNRQSAKDAKEKHGERQTGE
jgi:hypothetical protein